MKRNKKILSFTRQGAISIENTELKKKINEFYQQHKRNGVNSMENIIDVNAVMRAVNCRLQPTKTRRTI